MKETPITIQQITAENLYLFESLQLDLDQVKLLLVKGDNNVGKTSVLRLLALSVQGTANPRAAIRDGATKGNVEVRLSNGYLLRRSFTSTGENGREYFKVFDERGHEVPKPQDFVNRWLGELPDFNPLAWLNLATSDRSADRQRAVRTLLQAVDVRLTREEFFDATGFEPPTSVNFDGHGLEVIEALRGHYADERRMSNRDADTKKKAAADARAQLPPSRPVVTTQRRAEAEKARIEALQLRSSIEARQLAETSHTQAIDRINAEKEREAEERRRYESEIHELAEEKRRIDAKILAKEEQIKASHARTAQLQNDLEGLAASAPPTTEEMEACKAAVRHANELTLSIKADDELLTRFADVGKKEQEAADLAAGASILDETIKILDTTLRSRVMAKAKLPVESLALDGDSIIINGHPLDQTAESMQMRVACSIARALSPTLRQIALDGTERLSQKTFAAFLEEIRGDGFSYIATQVDPAGGPLQFVVFGETEDAVVEQRKAVA